MPGVDDEGRDDAPGGTGEMGDEDGDGLIGIARDLEAGGARRVRGVARRRGRTLHEGVVHDTEEAAVTEEPARARVRSETQETSSGGSLAGSGAPDGGAAVPAEPTLLGATGAPIVTGEGPRRLVPEATDPGTAVVEPAVFLVMAVRSYLEGLDAHGAEDAITLDRLARLRSTLAVYDGER